MVKRTWIMVREVDCACYFLLFAAVLVLLAVSSARATSTGLNNIPTTDTVPEKILVFQTWGNFAGGEHPDQFVGFKYGLFQDVEIGADWKANDKPSRHAAFQAKYAFNIEPDLLRGVVGVAELSDKDNRGIDGGLFPYAATSLDLKTVRLHLGYGAQPHNEAFFGGFDKTILFADRDLMLRFDGIHINDKDDMLLSAGYIYDLAPKTASSRPAPDGLMGFLDSISRNMLVESWVSKPTTGDKEVYTLKLNYVVRF
ncbi:MAG: hypothetical protein ACYS29_03160 [Planctomycetota bacterium]|jgi:hypothetical protein